MPLTPLTPLSSRPLPHDPSLLSLLLSVDPFCSQPKDSRKITERHTDAVSVFLNAPSASVAICFFPPPSSLATSSTAHQHFSGSFLPFPTLPFLAPPKNKLIQKKKDSETFFFFLLFISSPPVQSRTPPPSFTSFGFSLFI